MWQKDRSHILTCSVLGWSETSNLRLLAVVISSQRRLPNKVRSGIREFLHHYPPSLPAKQQDICSHTPFTYTVKGNSGKLHLIVVPLHKPFDVVKVWLRTLSWWWSSPQPNLFVPNEVVALWVGTLCVWCLHVCVLHNEWCSEPPKYARSIPVVCIYIVHVVLVDTPRVGE